MKTPVIYLNISKLTDYRKDGRPSIYRTWGKSKKQVAAQQLQDCSHWCLPGVPDTWNEFTTTIALFPGDMSGLSPATCRWGKLSPATCRWGSFVRDSFPSDNPQRR
ncbi:trichome birefringence-like protein 2, partial [Tanacetum coccineum]